MSATITTTAPVPISSIRSTVNKTRANPTRNSRNSKPVFRQHDILSNPESLKESAPTAQYGFYPAITHFTDAITALPRDFRRHTSLLKEVDTKAWALEGNLQILLDQCVKERSHSGTNADTQSVFELSGTEVRLPSAANSINEVSILENTSQASSIVPNPDMLKRRQLYAALRHNLMHLLMPLDEKNHVLSNAIEELVKHTRRQDEIWPHIAEEISEETRLGSLRHWALTDLNPSKKPQSTSVRGRETAAGVGMMQDEIAERSEKRREALLAKKKPHQLEADFENPRRVGSGKGKRLVEIEAELQARAKGKKTEKPAATSVSNLQRQVSRAGQTAVPMSREGSQQENTKKRKAPAATINVARKRMNTTAQGSPRLPSSSLAGPAKETTKNSPAMANSKLVPSRARTASAQAEIGSVDSSKVKQGALRRVGPGSVTMERSASRQSQLRRSAREEGTVRSSASPQPQTPLEDSHVHVKRFEGDAIWQQEEIKYLKSMTAQIREFEGGRTKDIIAESPLMLEEQITRPEGRDVSDTDELADQKGLEEGDERRRNTKPRMKDHHGLQDSLSPKALPLKRQHKKNGSYSTTATSVLQRNGPREEQNGNRSRTNSRSTIKMDGKNVLKEIETGSFDSSSSLSRRNTLNKEAARSTPRMASLDDGGSGARTGPDANGNPKAGRSLVRARPSRKNSSRAPTASQMSSEQAGGDAAVAVAAAEEDGWDSVSEEETPRMTLYEEFQQLSRDLEKKKPRPPKQSKPRSPTPQAEAVDESEGEGSDEDDGDEQRYCYCGQISYGEMVGCDNETCAREWFHLACTELDKLPSSKEKWYCRDCRAALDIVGVNGRGLSGVVRG